MALCSDHCRNLVTNTNGCIHMQGLGDDSRQNYGSFAPDLLATVGRALEIVREDRMGSRGVGGCLELQWFGPEFQDHMEGAISYQ